MAAVDLVMNKLEHQIERAKGRVVGRSHPRHPKSGRMLYMNVRTA
jgi:ribosome-associated translation inhibitor RaiA